jgi:hypothetical protein
MNRKWIAGAATLAVVTCSGMSIQALGAQAQTRPSAPSTPSVPNTMKGPEVEGRVRDVRGDQVTLSDGTKLTVPKSEAKMDEVKAGAKIKATYVERDGKKIVTALQVIEGPQGGSTR